MLFRSLRMLINTAHGWRQIAPLTPGMVAARDYRDVLSGELRALCPDAPRGVVAGVANAMLADLLSLGVSAVVDTSNGYRFMTTNLGTFETR